MEFLLGLVESYHAPLGIASDAVFIAGPAYVGPFDRDYSLGLQLANQLVPGGVGVFLAALGLGRGPIEPDFRDRPILREELVQLIEKIAIV